MPGQLSDFLQIYQSTGQRLWFNLYAHGSDAHVVLLLVRDVLRRRFIALLADSSFLGISFSLEPGKPAGVPFGDPQSSLRWLRVLSASKHWCQKSYRGQYPITKPGKGKWAFESPSYSFCLTKFGNWYLKGSFFKNKKSLFEKVWARQMFWSRSIFL